VLAVSEFTRAVKGMGAADMSELPLAGVRVLDLTRALAGPFCTMILGDLGAEVLKVEPLPSGDMIRTWGPFAGAESIYYLSSNRNKKSIALDLRSPRGLQVLQRLVDTVDTVVENFKVGTTDDMGISYESLAQRNPALIYCSVTGFGRGGPYGQLAGFDQIAQGMSGLMSLTGEDGSRLRIGIPIADLSAGMWAAIGVLSAVLQRTQTGKGQRVETSLLASLIGMLTFQGQRFITLGQVARSAGNDHPLLAPYGVFEAQDGAINLAVATDAIWARLCRAIGLDHLIGSAEFGDNGARRRNIDQLKQILEEKLRTKSKAQWRDILNRAGVPVGPINDIGEALTDPHVLQAGLIDQLSHPTLGTVAQLANPLKLGSVSQPLSRTAPPLLGEHSVEILEESGFKATEIAALLADKVVRDGRVGRAEP
jgi:crotonobetainyl-CoA:carnitine CoA-transferase CaiB-like acyl-CoA transferase